MVIEDKIENGQEHEENETLKEEGRWQKRILVDAYEFYGFWRLPMYPMDPGVS
jgi:hypothetical protein